MTRAVQIAELGDQNVFTIDGDNNRVGIGSTLPTAKLDVGGVVVATAFTGDGSNLTGINLSYVPTAGIATYATTAGIATNAQGLTGTPDISVTNITGVGATFSGDLNVTGTLTYEDVTNVDSIGIITARTGVRVTAGGLVVTDGGIDVTAGGLVVTAGISTLTDGIDASDLLKEEVNITAGKLSDNTNIDLENGMVHYFTTTETTTSTPNIRYSSSESLDSKMSVGQSIVVTLITTAAAGAYSANITIDSGAVTENWIGGSAPDAGGSSGVDIHTFTIIKTASATFTVIGNHSTTSA